MNTDKILTVSEIQRFCMHDGPGIRTTVFLKGCPLSCAWCHNPETQSCKKELLFYEKKCIGCGLCEKSCAHGVHKLGDAHELFREGCVACEACVAECPTGAIELCGRDMTADEIIEIVKKDGAFYGESGGVTISGGEPFLQKYATVELLKRCKEEGINTAVETCGFADSRVIEAALPYVDLFLWDIKDTSPERHVEYTGASNRLILKNLSLANSLGARIRLRCILVNGVNTNKEHYGELLRIANQIKNFDGIDFMPYHAYGGAKATFLGGEDNGRAERIPSDEVIDEAKSMFARLFN